MKSLTKHFSLISAAIALCFIFLAVGTINAYATTPRVDGLDAFLSEMEDVRTSNEALLTSVRSATDGDSVKSAITFNDLMDISDVEDVLRANSISAHAVYLRFVEEDGTIGTGYQILSESNTIDTQYINMMADQGIQFDGIASVEAIITPTQYQALNAETSVYIVDLGEMNKSYPQDYFWDLEKFSLTSNR